jgi:phosphomannomutase
MAKVEAVIDHATQKNIDSWLNGNYDEASKKEILRLQRENPAELVDAFYRHLDFGTGGLRGIMGVGTNRMNPYTVRAATQGLANYMLKQKTSAVPSVFIGFDCRHHSHEFATEAATVLAANGIRVYLYKDLRPVANISFGVLQKKCTAGIMITASHNPPQYNGYKVYWSYGGQVLPPHDQGIIAEVNQVTSTTKVKSVELPHPLVEEVGEELDKAYLKAIHEWQMHPGDNHTHGKELKVIYTSLHGGGITMIPSALKDWGFTNLTLVEAQAKPDGDFPTVKSPNPEEHAAMTLGIEKLKAVNGDILLGTDPDTDRLGVVIMHQGKPFFFDGNQVACLLVEHVCHSLRETRSMPPKAMFIKTIVTTELFRCIAEHYQAGCLDVLTGFKYVGEKIHQWEEEKLADVPSHHFILGAEESYGYLLGTHVRDKDAIISAACICEAALRLKLRKKTLVDLLNEIYLKYGVFREKLLSLVFEGKDGADKMQHMMEHLRKNPPKMIADLRVEILEDYQNHICLHVASGRKEPLLLPKSDVLRFWLEDQTKIVIRPSGTEPKIKLYCGVMEKHHQTDRHAVTQAVISCDARLNTLLDAIKKELLA